MSTLCLCPCALPVFLQVRLAIHCIFDPLRWATIPSIEHPHPPHHTLYRLLNITFCPLLLLWSLASSFSIDFWEETVTLPISFPASWGGTISLSVPLWVIPYGISLAAGLICWVRSRRGAPVPAPATTQAEAGAQADAPAGSAGETAAQPARPAHGIVPAQTRASGAASPQGTAVRHSTTAQGTEARLDTVAAQSQDGARGRGKVTPQRKVPPRLLVPPRASLTPQSLRAPPRIMTPQSIRTPPNLVTPHSVVTPRSIVTAQATVIPPGEHEEVVVVPGRWVVFLSFMMSITWIGACARELLGLLSSLGAILGASDAILGVTILAWGNSVGDLVTNITVALAGQPMMAVASCFAGPLFNLMLGLGIPMAIKTGWQYPVPFTFHRDPQLLMVFPFLLVGVLGSLLVVPYSGYKINRTWGYFLLGLYVTFIAVSLWVELFLAP